ncbi:hypothetical protein AC481_02365 [miscellaneous Crenarchaeota group archaeon SMTZ-80]|nr:MAG: hypothetical protein AC481_02365 [miscellaneous Crenarchaeota group archaeon SMTZ-80]
MIALTFDCELPKQANAVFIFDLFFSIAGLPYKIISKDSVNKKKYSIIINYGGTLSENFKKFVESGGFLINITNFQDIGDISTKKQKKGNSSDKPIPKNFFIKLNKKIPYYFPSQSLENSSEKTLYYLEDRTHPAVTLGELGKGILIKISIDIISSAFYILFQREFVNKEKNEQSSHFIINEYANLLQEVVLLGSRMKNIPLIQKILWPKGIKFVACIAHDIDWFNKWKLGLFELITQLWRSKKLFFNLKPKDALNDFISVMRIVLMRDEMSEAISKVLEMEDNLGVRSSFYFYGNIIPRFRFWIKNGDKSYDSFENSSLIKVISELGREIGLHGSYNSYENDEILSSEKQILERVIGKKILGIRQHCQKFNLSKTWKMQENSNFIYDVTRMDTEICHPFRGFYLKENNSFELIEIPLTIMDEPLTKYANPNILSRKRRQFIDEIKLLVDEVNRLNGVIVILWHPFEKYQGCLSAYREILKYLKKSGAYIATCGELVDWWNKHRFLQFIDAKKGQNCFEWRIRSRKTMRNLCFKILNSKGTISITGIDDWKLIRRKNIDYLNISELKASKEITLLCSTG